MHTLRLTFGIAVFITTTAHAQESRRSLDIGANNAGISIGDSRVWKGLRINFRDTRLERASGINITVWGPKRGGEGNVHGWSIGLLATGAANMHGIAFAPIGAGSRDEFVGIGVGGIGVGAGNSAKGILVGGVGVGGGGDITGIAIGGLGAGAGGEMRGVVIGGLGAGAGRGFKGIGVGGLGVGGGGDGAGIIVGGLGAGFGGSFTGVAIGGLGVGAGDDATGIFVAGFGVGSGATLRGLAAGLIGVGAPRIRGIAIGGLGVGGEDVRGLMVSGLMVRTARDGSATGALVSPLNQVRGYQKGVAIGLINYAWTLRGVQLGVINIVRDNPKGRRVLPVINW